MCNRSSGCCLLTVAFSDEWNKTRLEPANTQLPFGFTHFLSEESSRIFQRIFLWCFPISTLCILTPLSPEGRTKVVEVQAAMPCLTLKDRETWPFLPPLFYGGLMIYCSGFLLFSSYLEGGQFNKHACFLPRLLIVLTHREMCHGATVCSTAVTQFREFFTRTASAGSREIQQENQTWRPQLTLL